MKKRIGFGTYSIRETSILKKCLKQAIECGYDFVDTAFIYGNEKEIGTALRELEFEGYKKPIKIQTKIWPDFYDNVELAVYASMQKLQVSKLDMCLLHRPNYDFNKSISAWKKLVKLYQKNLIAEIGVSNFDRDAIEIMYRESGFYPQSNQIELSVNNYRLDRVVYNNAKKIEVQAWSPLGDIENNLKDKLLIELAQKYNTDVAGICIAYLSSLNHSVIVKSANEQRIKSNYNGFQIIIEKDDIEKIKKLNTFKIKFSESYEYDVNQ
ncbi:MAG: aldo/keto reductase [Malacoplasma sp.]|nr:aldo/keto reductase [Malacoplasma sp.]